MHIRTLCASAWMTKHQDAASYLVLATIGGNRLLLHAAGSGKWLFTVDWGGENVFVTEAGPDSRHQFRECQTALTFLDALLMAYVAALAKSGDQRHRTALIWLAAEEI